jgi:hypothetical protein
VADFIEFYFKLSRTVAKAYMMLKLAFGEKTIYKT